MHRPLILLAALSFLASCAPSVSTTGPAPTPTTVPSVAITLTTGRALTSADVAELRSDFQLTDPEIVHAPLLFATFRNDQRDIRTPAILRKDGTWKLIELTALHHTEWVYAGASIQRGELYAILDSTADTRGPALFILRSTDDGQSWSLVSSIKPPTLSAEFVAFTITPAGNAALTIHQDDDTSVPRGLYAYNSTDACKTWHGPQVTSDDLVSADLPAAPPFAETMRDVDPTFNLTPQRPTPISPFRQYFMPFGNNNTRRPPRREGQ